MQHCTDCGFHATWKCTITTDWGDDWTEPEQEYATLCTGCLSVYHDDDIDNLTLISE